MKFGTAICQQCGVEFEKAIHNQRFHSLKCKDDFHNSEKMVAYHLDKYQKKLAEIEAAEELVAQRREAAANGGTNGAANGAEVEHKPLSEILKSLKPAEPPAQRAVSYRRSFGA